MKKNKLIILIACLALIFVLNTELNLISIAKANPFFNWQTADTDPATIPPSIKVIGLENNTVYSNIVILRFDITAPKLRTAFSTGIASVKYTLNHDSSEVYSIFSSSSNGEVAGKQGFNYSKNLILTEGNYNLTIDAIGFVNPTNFSVFYVGSNSTVHFSVDAEEKSSTPTENGLPSVPIGAIYATIIIATVASIGIALRIKKRKN